MQKAMERQRTRVVSNTDTGSKGTLTVRELVFIGVGGIIGAGFFLGCGMPIRTAGPGVLIAYVLAALITAQVIGALTSLSASQPVSGSFKAYADMYIGRYAGFLQGWAYYVTSILTIASEAVAMGIFTKMWLPFLPTWLVASVYCVLILLLNAFGLRNFGRIESIMSAVKIAALLGFIVFIAIFVLSRGMTHAVSPGAPLMGRMLFPNGVSGIMQSMLIVVFAFAGIGVFGTAAVQIKNPKNIDKGAVWTVVGLTVLYLLSIGLLLFVEPWQQVSTASSPFVMALQRTGVAWLATVFNAVILVAAFSVMAGAVFSANQILYSLGESREAPKLVTRLSKNGAQLGALVITAVCIGATLCLSFLLPANVYNVLISASSYTTFLNWFVICWSFLAWRRRSKAGHRYFSKLAFGQPFATVVTMLLILVLAGYGLLQADERLGFFGFLGVAVVISVGYLAVRRFGHIAHEGGERSSG